MFNPPYWFWNGVLSDELCDSIIAEGDKLISGDGRVGGGNTEGSYSPEIRETNITFFPKWHWIEGIAWHYANIANHQAGWNISCTHPQNAQYCRYFPEQHYKPHRDDIIDSRESMRKLSVSISLTHPNEYRGGDFVIEDSSGCGNLLRIDDFRNRGSVIVFPSLMTHGVEPVTVGVRHSIVVWFEGPRWN